MGSTRATGPAQSELTPNDYLRALGESGDGPHDLATAALMLAALDRPEKNLSLHRAHLAEMERVVAHAEKLRGAKRVENYVVLKNDPIRDPYAQNDMTSAASIPAAAPMPAPSQPRLGTRR